MLLSGMLKAVGGLSTPSKMPGFGYSVSARDCKTGGKLAQVPGTSCNTCYAFRGHYPFPNVQKAMQRRLKLMTTDPQWVPNMVALLKHKSVAKKGVFRWFDSGDLQSVDNLMDIIQIAKQVPELRFWLPTKEYTMVYEVVYSRKIPIPENLVIRVSMPYVDMHQSYWTGKLPTSGVHKHKDPPGTTWECPAHHQGNKCRDCRACWEKDVEHVSYPWH